MATLRQTLQAALDVVEATNEGSPYRKTMAGLIAFDFLRDHGKSLAATLDAFDQQWRELQEFKRAAIAAGGEGKTNG